MSDQPAILWTIHDVRMAFESACFQQVAHLLTNKHDIERAADSYLRRLVESKMMKKEKAA